MTADAMQQAVSLQLNVSASTLQLLQQLQLHTRARQELGCCAGVSAHHVLTCNSAVLSREDDGSTLRNGGSRVSLRLLSKQIPTHLKILWRCSALKMLQLHTDLGRVEVLSLVPHEASFWTGRATHHATSKGRWVARPRSSAVHAIAAVAAWRGKVSVGKLAFEHKQLFTAGREGDIRGEPRRPLLHPKTLVGRFVQRDRATAIWEYLPP
jgi:hypothetical protein